MDYDKHFYIIETIDALRKAGSWTGKTHIQKTLAIASCIEAAHAPFRFVLYKHGPYSFEVDSELDEMASYGAVEFVTRQPYGPKIMAGEGAKFPLKLRSNQVSDLFIDNIQKTAQFVRTRTIIDLESLATATWIRTREGIQDDGKVLQRLKELKPHLATEVVEAGVNDSKTLMGTLAE